MDPGNWATALAGGAKFGTALLFVAVLSSLMAIVLQSLSARLGVGAGLDLAECMAPRKAALGRGLRLGRWRARPALKPGAEPPEHGAGLRVRSDRL